jgi:lysophospholipase L1-like esterase
MSMVHPAPLRQKIILFGDSDISRWPPTLHPSIAASSLSNYGKGGARLKDVLHQITTVLGQWELQIIHGGLKPDDTIKTWFICCAGENDISNGSCTSDLEQMFVTFRDILDALFPTPVVTDTEDRRVQQQQPNQRTVSKMIFFGPKFEPWLTDDNTAKKMYAKLDSGLKRITRRHHARDQIIYIDCLTLFCTKETASSPGAVYSGKAMPDSQYFTNDGLHLNDKGYEIWKQIVEEKIAES